MSDDRVQLVLAIPKDIFPIAVRFYRDGLGLCHESILSDLAIFSVGGRRLVLQAIPGDLVKRETGLQLHVHRMTEFWAHLQTGGFIAPGRAIPVRDRDGRVLLEDPAGNRLTLIDYQ